MNELCAAAESTPSTEVSFGSSPHLQLPLVAGLEELARLAFSVDRAVLSLSDDGLPLVSAAPLERDPGFCADVRVEGSDGRRMGILHLSHATPREDLTRDGLEAVKHFAELIAGLLMRAPAAGSVASRNDSAGGVDEVLSAQGKSLRDSLTGLPNQEALLRQLQSRIDRQHEEPRHYALLFVDIDFFKRINDSLGHLAADELLIQVGNRIEETVQTLTDCMVARLGGDEFAVLMGDVAGQEDAMTYAALLEYLLRRNIPCGAHEVAISASVGIAFGSRGAYADATQMLEDSDVAMTRAKRQGRAQCVVFSEKMRETARARLRLESDLREALREGQFDVHYQPKVRLESGKVKGFEALVRWRHPVRGPVSPAEFIPVAEDSGLINEIGRVVAVKAIRQLARWRRSGIVPQDATMAVNLSACQFHEPDLLEWIQSQLRIAELPPENLVLEVTESLIVEDAKAALVLLRAIVDEGIGLDLDDFGTGYSSLSYLHRFPFRSLKIDRSFIAQMGTEPKSESLVATIVGLARSMQMGVIAEGVETEVQAATLRRMGCAVAQGYLYSAAKPAEELERLLAAGGGVLEARPVVQPVRAAQPSAERMKATSGVHYLAALRFRGAAIGDYKAR